MPRLFWGVGGKWQLRNTSIGRGTVRDHGVVAAFAGDEQVCRQTNIKGAPLEAQKVVGLVLVCFPPTFSIHTDNVQTGGLAFQCLLYQLSRS